jgi:outer membrane protein assembly factor BamA
MIKTTEYVPKKLFILFVFAAGLSIFPVVAQDQARNSLVALPYVFYTPETKAAAGIGAIYSFRPKNGDIGSRPSTLKLAATYTQNKQYILALIMEHYLQEKSWYFYGDYSFREYPDKFWGIGNNTAASAEEDYKPRWLRSFTNIQKRIWPGFYAGMRYHLEHLKILEYGPDGILQNKTITGTKGGFASGMGFIFSHDTRNNIYFPTSGFYNQAHAVFFNKAIGSDFDFRILTADLRLYLSLFKNQVLAFQSYNIFGNGDVPINLLGQLGGGYWARGYYLGRYRDKNMMAFQTEYRVPLFWRFGAAAFIGVGSVANRVADFKAQNLKVTKGLGLRFKINSQENINARVDLGFSPEGDVGVYMLIVEAF